jgi:3-oxoacyl-[acyl-carrier protein] reductase
VSDTHEQTVLVTGAAKGIGRHVASTFARAGARVAINDIEDPHETLREVERCGAEGLSVIADVRDDAAVRSMMDQVNGHFGRIDVLVNNAAIVTHFSWMPRWPRIRDMDKAFWDRVIDTNLGGTFLCTRHVLPFMERQGSGHIINLHGAGSPRIMGVGACVYGVSKDAIRTFTGFVAEEEREFNVRVVLVVPNVAIATEEAPQELRDAMAGPEHLGDVFVQAAQVGMDLTGEALTLQDGRLEVFRW